MKSNSGNAFIIALIFTAVILSIFIFIIAIFMSEVGSLLHSIKLDMYSINKSAVIAVNKYQTSLGYFSYSKKDFRENLKSMLMKNYNLDNNLCNKDGIIQQVSIIDCNICKKRTNDPYTKERLKNMTIHSLIKVKVKPIILEEQLSDLFTFYVHEDVILNELIT
jgi:hypothetical protein